MLRRNLGSIPFILEFEGKINIWKIDLWHLIHYLILLLVEGFLVGFRCSFRLWLWLVWFLDLAMAEEVVQDGLDKGRKSKKYL